MTGGISLYIDAVANLVQMSLSDPTTICAIAIFDTVIFHYISYFSVVFRAYRVFKVMKLERKYLEDIYRMKKIRADQFDKENQVTMNHTDEILEPKNLKDLTKSRMRESEFEEELIKNKEKREKEIKACQEAYFLKWIAYIVFVTTIFGTFSYFYINSVFNFMPVFRSFACRKLQSEDIQPS